MKNNKEDRKTISESIAIIEEYKAEHGVYPSATYYSDAARTKKAHPASRALIIVMQQALKRPDEAEIQEFMKRYRADKTARGHVAKARAPRNVQELRIEARKIDRGSAPVYQEPTPTSVEVTPNKPRRAATKRNVYQTSLNNAMKMLGEEQEAVVQVSTGDALTSVRLYVRGARDLVDQVGIILGGMVPRLYDIKLK